MIFGRLASTCLAVVLVGLIGCSAANSRAIRQTSGRGRSRPAVEQSVARFDREHDVSLAGWTDCRHCNAPVGEAARFGDNVRDAFQRIPAPPIAFSCAALQPSTPICSSCRGSKVRRWAGSENWIGRPAVSWLERWRLEGICREAIRLVRHADRRSCVEGQARGAGRCGSRERVRHRVWRGSWPPPSLSRPGSVGSKPRIRDAAGVAGSIRRYRRRRLPAEPGGGTDAGRVRWRVLQNAAKPRLVRRRVSPSS